MKVKLTKILSENDKDIKVEFSTDTGRCRALWRGKKPEVEALHGIELEIPSIFQWRTTIVPYHIQISQMKIHENNVSLIGSIDRIEDTLFSLKLGHDIILIEAEGVPFEKGMFVEVVAEKIIAYDTNI